MVQPASSVQSQLVAPVQAVADMHPPESSSRPTDAGGAAADLSSDALSAGVEKAADGVFVYTLRDTDSGTLLVVIPHVELKTGAEIDTWA